MNAVSDLRARILSFLAGRSSLSSLSSWVLESLLELEESEDRVALAQFYCVAGILAEASHAEWSDEGLRRELEKAAHSLKYPLRNPEVIPT